VFGPTSERRDIRIDAESLEGPLVIRVTHAHEPGVGRPVLQAFQELLDGTESESRVAPVDRAKRLELMLLHRVDQLRRTRSEIGGRAERAVTHMETGPP